jgi:hypothetical protein
VVTTAAQLCAGDEPAGNEYELKAAFLYHFALFVQYPSPAADPKDPFAIGVLGKDPFGASLDRVAAIKTVDGRPITIRRFRSVEDYKQCSILFIAIESAADEGETNDKKDSPEDRLAALLDKVKDAPVLIVGDSPGLGKRGAIINFYIQENKIRFEINKGAAKKHGLQLSSKLLKLGKIVSEDKD